MGCAGSATYSSQAGTHGGTVHPPPKLHSYPTQQHAPVHQVNPHEGHLTQHLPYPPQPQGPTHPHQPLTLPAYCHPYPHPQQPPVHPQQPPPPYSEHPPTNQVVKLQIHHQQPRPPPQQAPSQRAPPQQAPPQRVPPQQALTQPPQHHQNAPATSTSSTAKATEGVEFNEALVTTLMDLDQNLAQLERRNVFKQHKLKYEQLVTLTAQVKGLTEEQQRLEAQTQKEYQDVVDLQSNPTVRAMMSQMQFDQQMTKEQQEYMDALNRQEMHKKQLQSAVHTESVLKREVQQLHQASEELKALFDKQDDILSSIFDGKYGSELEYSLETELDHLLEYKQRISVAKYKWKNSRILIQHACSQFGFAVRRWNDVVQVPVSNQALRYQFAAEARNNLVAGIQNVDSAHRYLNTIKFPYCTPDELKTVNTALQFVFTDLNTPERHKHALECYMNIYRRSGALVQWFDRVINKTIMTDLDRAKKECAAKQRELKLERLGLIREKITAEAGSDIADKLEMASQGMDEDDIEPEEEELADLVEADSVSQAGDGLEEQFSGEANDGPTPLSSEELADTPPVTDIFGNIEELKKQHEEQMKQFTEQQELSKARANEDLQAKLARRMSRRNRMAQQDAEMSALGSG